jgi:hypothetical protein
MFQVQVLKSFSGAADGDTTKKRPDLPDINGSIILAEK